MSTKLKIAISAVAVVIGAILITLAKLPIPGVICIIAAILPWIPFGKVIKEEHNQYVYETFRDDYEMIKSHLPHKVAKAEVPKQKKKSAVKVQKTLSANVPDEHASHPIVDSEKDAPTMLYHKKERPAIPATQPERQMLLVNYLQTVGNIQNANQATYQQLINYVADPTKIGHTRANVQEYVDDGATLEEAVCYVAAGALK